MISCTRDNCPTPKQSNHYHCGRCTSPAITSMLGHYSRDENGIETFSCKEEDKIVTYGVEMSFNGDRGRFLTEDEYDELTEESEGQEELEELRMELNNLRQHIAEAKDHAHELYYHLGNA